MHTCYSLIEFENSIKIFAAEHIFEGFKALRDYIIFFRSRQWAIMSQLLNGLTIYYGNRQGCHAYFAYRGVITL